MTVRLTRKEQQAQTRAALLESATRVLAARGLHGASIDDITAHAGFTKGAFYANFDSKQALYLAMLDEHFAERLAAVERLFGGGGSLADRAESAGRDFAGALRADADQARLFLEFTAHAARDEAFAREFVPRTQAIRADIAELFSRRAAEAGFEPPIPPAHLARMVFAMAHGVAIDGLLDEGTPPDLLGEMLRIVMVGLGADDGDGRADGR